MDCADARALEATTDAARVEDTIELVARELLAAATEEPDELEDAADDAAEEDPEVEAEELAAELPEDAALVLDMPDAAADDAEPDGETAAVTIAAAPLYGKLSM